jgi:exodeoxyribonuclease VII large subunit
VNPPAAASEVYGVSRVVTYINRLLQANHRLKALRVRGEVSNLRTLAGGHQSFDLKEGADVLACILWASSVAHVPSFENGQEVIASGYIASYRVASKYQLYVAALELAGAGALYAQLELLKRKFRGEGLFEPSRKRPIPPFPKRLALISAQAKGAEDFVTALSARAPHIGIDFIETRVQGVGAEIDIAAALDRASRLPVEVIVLARGGGSFEDLFPFNLEPVVRAIVRAKHPVLTAIGHTGDRHLADDVADLSVETPSNAAHYFISLRDSALAKLARLQNDLARTAQRRVLEAVRQFDAVVGRLRALSQVSASKRRELLWRIAGRLDRQKPESRVRERARRFDQVASSLHGAARSVLQRAKHRAEIAGHRLEALNPQAPLARGYAIVTLDGKVLRDAALARAGELVEARLQRGTLEARVERAVADA